MVCAGNRALYILAGFCLCHNTLATMSLFQLYHLLQFADNFKLFEARTSKLFHNHVILQPYSGTRTDGVVNIANFDNLTLLHNSSVAGECGSAFKIPKTATLHRKTGPLHAHLGSFLG